MFKTIAHQSAIQFASRAVSLALALGIVALTTRSLGPAGFGEYTTVVAFLQFVSLVIGFGLGMTLTRELGRGELPESVVLANAFSLRVVTAGLAFVLAPLTAWLLGYPHEIVSGISLAAVAFWAMSIGQMLTSVYQVKMKSVTLAWLELTARLILAIGTYLVVRMGIASPTAYLVVIIVTNLVATALNVVAVHRLIPFRWQIDRTVWKVLWRVAWPSALTTTLNVIYFKADTVILSLLRPAAEVGQYGTAYAILEALLALPAVIGGLLLPHMARAHTAGERGTVQQLYRGSFDALLTIGLAITTGALLLGRPLVTALAGEHFAVAGDILGVLCLALLCSFVGNAAAYTVFAIGEQRRLISVFAVGAVVGLASYLIFIPHYSYWGAAWSTVATEAVVNLGIIVVLWRLGITPHYERLLKIAAVTLLLAVGLVLPLPLAGQLAAGGTLWLASVWLLKLVPRTSGLAN